MQAKGVKYKIYADLKIYRKEACSQEEYFLQDAVDNVMELSKEGKIRPAPENGPLTNGSFDNILE